MRNVTPAARNTRLAAAQYNRNAEHGRRATSRGGKQLRIKLHTVADCLIILRRAVATRHHPRTASARVHETALMERRKKEKAKNTRY